MRKVVFCLILCICLGLCACSANNTSEVIPDIITQNFDGEDLILTYYVGPNNGCTIIDGNTGDTLHFALTGDTDGFSGVGGGDTVVEQPYIDLPSDFNWLEDWQTLFKDVDFNSMHLDTESILAFGQGYRVDVDKDTYYSIILQTNYLSVFKYSKDTTMYMCSVQSYTFTDEDWSIMKSGNGVEKEVGD